MVLWTYTLRLLASIALLAQLALPYAQASATTASDMSALICNPSGRAVSADAKAAMTSLLSALNEATDTDEKPDTAPHCEICVTQAAAITSRNAILADRVTYETARIIRPRNPARMARSPRGPPCGTRAPPTFV